MSEQAPDPARVSIIGRAATHRADPLNGVAINAWANTDRLDPPFASPPDALTRLVRPHRPAHVPWT